MEEKKEIKEKEEFLIQFFEYGHLPKPLQDISQPFCDMAKLMTRILPRNPERSTALRKILEAKDCAIRAWVAKK